MTEHSYRGTLKAVSVRGEGSDTEVELKLGLPLNQQLAGGEGSVDVNGLARWMGRSIAATLSGEPTLPLFPEDESPGR